MPTSNHFPHQGFDSEIDGSVVLGLFGLHLLKECEECQSNSQLMFVLEPWFAFQSFEGSCSF